MKNLFVLFTILFFISCGKQKVVELPEISHADITEIQDVSAAYLFYDETQPDSVLLNRKNLISTTNWLINVDKRLTLKQVIPHIKFLQEKKANAGHKNENAKNYFTCHDTSENNLGFIEFTDINYTKQLSFVKQTSISSLRNLKNQVRINFNSSNIARIININSDSISKKIVKTELIENLKELDSTIDIIHLDFNSNLLFQDYISFKSIISEASLSKAKISNKEYIYN